MTTKQHVEQLLKSISRGLFEKEHILALALLCAISGKSYFLLGPPGTAKSEIARRLKLIFEDAHAFEYLMSRFSTPDEIFGPISIQKLKSEDTYERKVEGFLPTATVVFLDEIWKAGPAIQNALLTVVNERIYQNGSTTLQLPMKCLIAASNELPAEGEGLEALWDRFLVRAVSNCISDEKTFYKMLCVQERPKIEIPKELQITNACYTAWQQAIAQINIPNEILEVITAIRTKMVEFSKAEHIEPADYYISDRRWRNCVQLMRASAFLNSRATIDYSDSILLIYTLWNKVDCIENVLHAVTTSVFHDIEKGIVKVQKALEEAKNLACTQQEQQVVDSEQFCIYEYFYYMLLNYPDGKCYFYQRDYKYLKSDIDVDGLVYYDPQLSATVVSYYSQYNDAFSFNNKQNVRRVALRKNNVGIDINGISYSIQQINKTTTEQANKNEINPIVLLIDSYKQTLNARWQAIKESKNLFLSTDDLNETEKVAKKIGKQLDIERIKALTQK